MTIKRPHRLTCLILSCAAALLLIGWTAPSRAQAVACMVNGAPITNYDIEQRSKLTMLTTHKTPERQQVINELVDEKLKVSEAKKFGVDPTSSDVEQAYGSMSTRMRITSEQLTKSLESQGIRPDTLKSRIKAEMVWSSLVRGRYKESLQVSEKDVQRGAAEKSEGTAEKPDAESFEYQMQPIVLIAPRGSPPAAIEVRQKEAEALRSRVQTCAEANSLFKTMQNAAIRDIVTKTSADIPEVLRKVLDDTPIGHLTAPEVTKQGVEMVALCGRKPTTVDTPKKKEIRDKMYGEKYEAKQKWYLNEIHKTAMIECH